MKKLAYTKVMKVPDPELAQSVLNDIAGWSLFPTCDDGWSILNKRGGEVARCHDLVEVWTRIRERAASVLNEHQRARTFSDLYTAADEDAKAMMRELIDRYHNSRDARNGVEVLLSFHRDSLVDPDDLPPEWLRLVREVRALGRGGYSLPAQIDKLFLSIPGQD